MKTKMKVLLVVLSAMFLIAGTVFGTLAYLTSTTKAIRNTFTVGKVEITLDEAKVDEYGEEIQNADRVKGPDGNEYKLIPGHTYTKDPTVTVLGKSEKAYVRMLVTITDFADVKRVFGDDFLPQNFVNGTWDSTKWISTGTVDVDEEKNTATYEFRYFKEVDAREGDVKLDPLFEEIFVPGTVSGDDIAKLGEMEIQIVAHAIQADGFKDADEAWKAFDADAE